MVHHDICPVCSSGEISLYLKCTDHFVSKEVFDLFKCKACGFQFTQDYPEENEIGPYYESEDYISHSNTSKGLSNKLYLLARNFMLRRKMNLIKNVTGLKKGTILDIGSGTGHFADTMKRVGWQVKGIEINKQASSFSKDHFGLDVIDPESVRILPTSGFDCITLWHVLEHFHDPYYYASEILRMLKPGGVCVIALPNSNSFDAYHFGKFWAAYDVPRHIWHFNPETFRIFSENNGFKTEAIKKLPLDVFYISILSEKYKGSSFSFIKGILKASLFAVQSIFNKQKSSSIVYILRK